MTRVFTGSTTEFHDEFVPADCPVEPENTDPDANDQKAQIEWSEDNVPTI